MKSASKNLRLHIGIFGRRNVGKSSILNALCAQSVSIVSPVAGTTTDPVEKPMELLPLGPVLFIDTAGIDDEGALGEMRIAKTQQVFDRTDLACIVCCNNEWGVFEEQIFAACTSRSIPIIAVVNKIDLSLPSSEYLDMLRAKGAPPVAVSAVRGVGIDDLRAALITAAPEHFINTPQIVADLVPAGKTAVLVVPIDKEAPKGRLILPQVQTIRDLLDNDAMCVVVKERELRAALNNLKEKPALVVTDSQAFLKVAADTPDDVLMTSFSILFARFNGDLAAMVRGACSIDALRTGDKVLIAEACSHHPIGEDIGTVKIPRWLTQYVGGALEIVSCRGHDFPENIGEFKLVIHCGACMWNRREMLSRIGRCASLGVPITNYGLTIAYTQGIFARALRPFPAAYEVYKECEGRK